MHKVKLNCCQCRISETHFLMDTCRTLTLYIISDKQTTCEWHLVLRVSDAQRQTPSQLVLDRLLCLSPDVCKDKHQPPMTLKGISGLENGMRVGWMETHHFPPP